jgi:hypothetical protein
LANACLRNRHLDTCILAFAAVCCANPESPHETQRPNPTPAHGESRPPAQGSATDEPAPQPGDSTYELRLIAKGGSRKGKSVSGYLTLRKTLADERSPRTGETAVLDPHFPAWGWTDADLRQVGAPLCDDDLHPSPGSHDPVYPGVVILDEDARVPLRPRDRPFLLIATLTNLRNGMTPVDGCGIWLPVKRHDARCFRGWWEGFGTAYDGFGSFSLCPATHR